MTRVGIIGLGYVGLPLAAAFAETGVDVLGVDVFPPNGDALSLGRAVTELPPASSSVTTTAA